MQLTDRVKNCNGCEACVVGCKYNCVKMEYDDQHRKYPVINEDGCTKCNNCFLYCPLYNPLTLPEFEEFYEYKEEFYERDMAAVYREITRTIKSGSGAEFVGTLCQIAALKSLMGDRLPQQLRIYPLYCDPQMPRRPECGGCPFCK